MTLIPIPDDANNLPNFDETWSEEQWQAFFRGVGDINSRLAALEAGVDSLELIVTATGGPTDLTQLGITNPINITQTWAAGTPSEFATNDTTRSNIRLSNNTSDAALVRGGLVGLLFIPQIDGEDIGEHSIKAPWGVVDAVGWPLPFSDDQNVQVRVISEPGQNRLTYRISKGTDSMPADWGYQVYLVRNKGLRGPPGRDGADGGNAPAPHASSIPVESAGFTGNLTPADDDVQAVAQAFDGYAPTPAEIAAPFVAGAGNADADIGLNVVAGVIEMFIRLGVIQPSNLAPYGTASPTRAWLDRIGLGSGNQINLDTDAGTGGVSIDWNPNNHWVAIGDAFEDGGWAAGGGVTAPQAAAFTAQSAPLATYSEHRVAGPHATNWYVGIRIPVDEKDNLVNWRLVIGEDIEDHFNADYPAAGRTTAPVRAAWTHLADVAGQAYYAVQVVDIPAADEFGLQKFTPFHVNPSVVDLRGRLAAEDVSLGSAQQFVDSGVSLTGVHWVLVRFAHDQWEADWRWFEASELIALTAATAGSAPATGNSLGFQYDVANSLAWMRLGRLANGNLLIAGHAGSADVRTL